MKPLIIPVFIPHEGCPHRCVFCEQRTITAQKEERIGPDHVASVLKQATASARFDVKRKPEVAFYGGTFTGLQKRQMVRLLKAVEPFMDQGLIQSIRVSTRPDALDEDRLTILKTHGVRTVELGVQSMNDEVLAYSKRGHTARDSVEAVQTLKTAGFGVGVQLMPGLPGDSKDVFTDTVQSVLRLEPDMVRLYPTVVIRGTQLARMYAQGRYHPLTLDEAVDRCVEATVRLETNQIPVIRIGLHGSPSLAEKGQIVAGPWHPAFGFLVRSAIHHRKVASDLPATVQGRIRLFAPRREIPLLRGHRNQGILAIEHRTGSKVVNILPDDQVPEGRVRVEVL